MKEKDGLHASWPSVLQALAVAAVPLAIALVGHLYTQGLKEREVQARFVELALTILQTPPDSATRNLRTWAIRVVNEYSSVPMDSVVEDDLRQAVTLPTVGLSPGTPVFVRVRLPFPARVRWARHYRPDLQTTVERDLGPGVDSFPLPFGSTILLTVIRAGSSDSSVHKLDCSRGCMLELP